MTGRKKPYTDRGLRRLRCARCHEPAMHQWRACADGKWRPICRACDILLNRIALMFLFPEDSDGNNEKMERYIATLNK